MAPRRDSPIERAMMAIVTIIVILIFECTVLSLAGETLVSSLSTVAIGIPIDVETPSKTVTPAADKESRFYPGEGEAKGLQEEHFFLSEPSDESLEIDSALIPEVISGPRLSKSELSARQKVVSHLGGEEKYLSAEENMQKAFSAAENALLNRGVAMSDLEVIGIIDYTKPSYARRLSIYHPRSGKQTRHLVSHGANNGKLYATKFSNRRGSHQSSPGLYQIGKRYRGAHGSSLRLHGLEKSNDQAFRRAIVMHSAWYVSYQSIVKNLNEKGVPRLGRSHGCPAVHAEELEFVLSKLVPESFLYIYVKL